MEPIYHFVDHQDLFWDAESAPPGPLRPISPHNTVTYIWLRDASRARAVADDIMRANDPGIESTRHYPDTLHGVPHDVRADGTDLEQGNGMPLEPDLLSYPDDMAPRAVERGQFCKSGSDEHAGTPSLLEARPTGSRDGRRRGHPC